MPTEIGEGRFRVGPPGEPVNLRMQVGICSFASPDAALLVSLLPAMIVARGEPRLALLLQLVGDEARTPARRGSWSWSACSRSCSSRAAVRG